jgi:hypothetical protein
VIKRQFGHAKVRYSGLSKNTVQPKALFALSILWMARAKSMALDGRGRPLTENRGMKNGRKKAIRRLFTCERDSDASPGPNTLLHRPVDCWMAHFSDCPQVGGKVLQTLMPFPNATSTAVLDTFATLVAEGGVPLSVLSPDGKLMHLGEPLDRRTAV